MSGHTPGPWAVVNRGGMLNVSAPRHGGAIVSLGVPRSGERMANANLIAAAPDLLAALVEARNGLGWYRAEFPDANSGADDEVLARIDDAIAKAEGES